MNLNNLAIVLTKKIEADLVEAFHEKGKIPPSFYNIRRTLVETLENYMGDLAISESWDQKMLDSMTPQMAAGYKNHQLEKQACEIVKTIIESHDYFDKFEFKDEYDRYRSITRSIIVLKTGKIRKDANEVTP